MNPDRVALSELTRYLDGFLRVGEITDYPNALNGLQVENGPGRVSRFGAAVDATLATVEMAATRGVDCLLVHHGLFWGGNQPVVGHRFRLLRRALEANVAVYSSHLPLDYHPGVGNNAGLCAALGFERTTPFLPAKGGFPAGLRATVALTRDELVGRLERAVGGGSVRVCPGGPARVREVGVVTGGRGGHVRHRRGDAPDLRAGGGTRRQRPARRSLRHGNLRRAGARRAPLDVVRPALGIPGPADGAVSAVRVSPLPGGWETPGRASSVG